MRTILFVAIVSAALCQTAQASPASDLAVIDAKLKACTQRELTNIGMKSCTSAAFDAANKVLNSLYRSIVFKLKSTAPSDPEAADNAEILKRLVAAERVWTGYRQAECSLQGVEMLGGSGEGLVVLGCLYTPTRARVQDLDALLGGAARK